ncbi:MAG: hypothetical protein GY796_30675 [Chloroflexi bacterium]|nr:hypothetical protein [Chloroflexota bacterium]
MSLHWYVLRVKPHKERVVCRQLLVQDETVFAPVLQVKPKNPRAAKQRPYFPGYIFVQADLDVVGKNAYSWIHGTRGLVSFGGIPAVVPDSLIIEVEKQAAETLVEENAQQKLEPGERVQIVQGLFAGYDGIFDIYLSGTERVQVLLTYLNNHPWPLKLDREDVEKLKHNTDASFVN